MLQAIALALLLFVLLLLPTTAIALGWLWWRAEEEAREKVFGSSIDHARK